jgi:hypothetical protein
MKQFLVIIFVLFNLTGIAHSSPLRLDYSVDNSAGGLFNYEFSLTLDNNDNSWSAGQGWGWFVFGDAQNTQSPLTDFEIDSSDFPVGPWTSLTTSSGGHNGPTFNEVSTPWVPTSIGEILTWSGTSTANLAQGELLFSTLFPSNGAEPASFEVANRLASVPIPAAMWLFGSGVIGLIGMRKRSPKSTLLPA